VPAGLGEKIGAPTVQSGLASKEFNRRRFYEGLSFRRVISASWVRPAAHRAAQAARTCPPQGRIPRCQASGHRHGRPHRQDAEMRLCAEEGRKEGSLPIDGQPHLQMRAKWSQNCVCILPQSSSSGRRGHPFGDGQPLLAERTIPNSDHWAHRNDVARFLGWFAYHMLP